MTKDDYKTEFEEHRKEISLDEGHDMGNLPSRTELHRKSRKPKKKSGHLLINVILGLFTLIPVLILVYFLSDFYLPEDSTKAKVDNSGSIYEVNKPNSGNTDPGKTDVASENKDDEESKENTKEIDKVEAETKPNNEPKTETKVEEKPATKPVVNVNPAPEQKPEQKPTGKTHTVANGETLYRIALNYYGVGSEAGIDKIKQANGLSSNEIKTGQKLIIP